VRLLALAASLLAAAWLAPSALAHANVVSTTPRDGDTVSRAPREVRVLFDDPVSVGPGNAVVARDRTSVLAGAPRLERAGRELVLPLQPLVNGDYSARWRIVSDDGHLESGVLAFRVGPAQAGAAAPRSVLVAEAGRPSVEDVFARLLFLGGILLAGGAALFRLLVTRADARSWATTVTVALVSAVLGGVSLLNTSHAASTRFGYVTKAAVIVAGAGAIAAAFAPMYPRLVPAAMAASLALLAAPTLAGHAFRPTDDRPLSVAADFLHVAAAAFWIGGLLQLALVLWSREDGRAPARFSRLALPAVLVIAASGAGRAVVELTSFSQVWSTGYGRTIVVKTALFAVLIGLAWISRSRLGSAARLLRSVSGEIAVLALVVGAVAVLTALRPGRDVGAQPAPAGPTQVARAPSPPRGAVVLARESQELAVALAIQPGRPLRLTATIIGQTGFGVDGLDVDLGASNTGRDASVVARPCGHGCYTAAVRLARPTRFAVTIAGAGLFRRVSFALPGPWPPRPDRSFLRRATRVFNGLRSAVFLEHLRSRPGNEIVTRWKLAAPDRLQYAIRGGAGGIVVGQTRWDRAAPGAPWKRSVTGTVFPQPTAPWGPRVRDAHVLESAPDHLVLSWLDPEVPAWFTVTFDRRTALPTNLSMTAAGHFMRHRYLAYNQRLRIVPPRNSSG
jgi:copper transport protein